MPRMTYTSVGLHVMPIIPNLKDNFENFDFIKREIPHMNNDLVALYNEADYCLAAIVLY